MYKAVIFDFGNVLCRIDREGFVQKAARYSRTMTPDQLLAALWGTQLEYEFETGRFDSREYFRKVQELAALDPAYSYEEFVEDYKKIIVPDLDGERALELAARRGARTFVLSNTSFLHASCLFDREALGTWPELYIFSYKVGVMKPHPRLWETLLHYARLEPADCLYIDDVESYCAAARALGMDAVRFDYRKEKLFQIVENMLE